MHYFTHDRPRKYFCLFPVKVKKKRICRSVKYIFFVQKCVFYACFMLIGSWKGRKNFGVGIFRVNTCLVGLQETNNFFRPNNIGLLLKKNLFYRIQDKGKFGIWQLYSY